MTTSARSDIEYLGMIPPPGTNSEGLDSKALPKYLPGLSENEEAPKMVHPDEMKIYSSVADILVGEDSDGKSEDNDTDFEDMSKEESEREYQKLLPGNKIRYIQFYSFHLQLQRNERCSGMLYQTICHQMCSELYPTMPEAIASEEMSTYDVDPNHVQVEKVIQKDGAVVEKILPILIKGEPNQEHTTKEPSIMTPY